MLVELKDFSFTYHAQKRPSLQDISLSLREGEKIAIVGPSGCGKSTLMHVLNGIIPHHFSGSMKGYARVAGRLICEGVREDSQGLAPIREISKRVATVLQDPDGQFIGLTVAEDLAFMLENERVDHARMHQLVPEMARLVGMEEFLSASPQLLSGGQKQRVSLGGVLIGGATELLLCDEPLAALDPMAGMETIELLHKMRDSHACIIVEHRLEDVLHRPLDRIVLMHQGRIISDSSPEDLLRSGLLEAHGVRSPLYVSALRYAGVELDSCKNLAQIQELELDEEAKGNVRAFARADSAPSKQSPKPLLEICDLSFSYPAEDAAQKAPVISHLNLVLNEGDMISVCGCNGAGKSSLAKLLCGFEKPSSGDILYKGRSLLGQSIAERASYIAYVLQDPNHMISQPTVKEEVGLAFKFQDYGLSEEEQEARLEKVLKICGLYPYRNWPISVLSYGQKKRVTIASVLVSEPKIIILDEPTAGQDWAHYTEIMEFLKSLNEQGVGIILITHDMHLALEYTNKTAVLVRGKLLAYEPCSLVLTNPELCREAHLKMTSLYYLAQRAGLEQAQDLVDAFIMRDKKERPENILARTSKQEACV